MDKSILTKKSQYSTVEDAVNKVKEATLHLKSCVDETVEYLKDCERLVSLNQKLGMDKFYESLILTAKMKHLHYLIHIAIVDLLRFESDN